MGWSTVSSGLLDNLHTRIFLVYSHLSGGMKVIGSTLLLRKQVLIGSTLFAQENPIRSRSFYFKPNILKQTNKTHHHSQCHSSLHCVLGILHIQSVTTMP
jgi:hypothetical protein